MEIKKSYKADLEHRRPYVFAAAFVGVTLFFVAILFVPFKSISQLMEDAFDDFSQDLDLKSQDQDDMISASEPQPESNDNDKQSEMLNPVDDAPELSPEQVSDALDESDDELDEADDDEEESEPINQNGDDPEAQKIVEELPQFPGGMVEFMKWLTATLHYPDQALRQHIQGKVMVSFIVGTDGSISNIKLTKTVNRLLDNEALRVIRMMPKWKPGTEKGKPCRSMVAIPVVFEI